MRSPLHATVALLDRLGPGLTTDLAQALRAEGLGADAARKRLSRLPEEVQVLRGIRFPKRARFLYLPDQFGTHDYWDALIRAIQTSSPSYAAALAGLQARQGIVPLSHFPIVSGSPIRQKRHLSASIVLDGLKDISLVKQYYIEGIGDCAALNARTALGEVADRTLRARLLTEDVLLNAIRSWAGKLNFASPNKIEIRDLTHVPNFGTFNFDLTGPSYVFPVRRHKKNRMTPGFLAADVITGLVLSATHVQPFLRKCQTLSHLRQLPKFFPMLIADGFEEQALRDLRAFGVLATTPSTLFGDDVGRALKDLFETLTNAAAVAASNPEKLENLFSKLGKIEGAAGNLRGALFELLVGHIARELHGGSIDIGKPVYDSESHQYREIDVLQVIQKQITIYECRGHRPNKMISLNETETWLTQKVPVIHNALRSEARLAGFQFTFQLWTTGGFHPDALARLKNAKKLTKKYEIAWKDGPGVREQAGQLAAPGVAKILDEHYFKHPLTEVEPAWARSNPNLSLLYDAMEL
jgi:hypothetical protein